MNNTSVINSTAGPPVIGCDYMFPPVRPFMLVVNVGLTGAVIVLGLIGNAFAISVMRSKQYRTGTTSFLLAVLAIADSCYLFFAFFFVVIANLYRYVPDVHIALLPFFPHVEPYIWPLASTSQTAATWLVVVVTADRYIAICWPLRARQLCTMRRVKTAVFVTVILSLVFNIPRFWELQPINVYNGCLGIPDIIVKSVKKDYVYWLVYSTILHFLFRNILPFALLSIFNTRLFAAIRDSRQKFQEIAPGQTSGNGKTFNVIIVVVLTTFLICSVPEFFYRVTYTVSMYTGEMAVSLVAMEYLGNACNFFLTVNSALNCVIYCAVGKRFRLTLVRLLCNRKKKKRVSKTFSSPLSPSLTTTEMRLDTTVMMPLHSYQ